MMKWRVIIVCLTDGQWHGCYKGHNVWHHGSVQEVFEKKSNRKIMGVHVGEYGVNWNMEFNILALFSHQDELCFRNSNTLCLYVCMFFLCIKLHIESMFMY
ncbi:hypothetical protein ERO13_A02G048600v2 [Gossypium hirsutum]|nr:hypothetical protein ERO13_A02G048600v2 [Gossypium hirsutum]